MNAETDAKGLSLTTLIALRLVVAVVWWISTR